MYFALTKVNIAWFCTFPASSDSKVYPEFSLYWFGAHYNLRAMFAIL